MATRSSRGDNRASPGRAMRDTLFAGIGYLLLFGTIVAVVALWHGFAAAPARPASEIALDLHRVDPARASISPRKPPFD